MSTPIQRFFGGTARALASGPQARVSIEEVVAPKIEAPLPAEVDVSNGLTQALRGARPDALRLPRPTRSTPVELRRAVARIIAADRSGPAPSAEMVEKEARMVHALRMLEASQAGILSKSRGWV